MPISGLATVLTAAPAVFSDAPCASCRVSVSARTRLHVEVGCDNSFRLHTQYMVDKCAPSRRKHALLVDQQHLRTSYFVPPSNDAIQVVSTDSHSSSSLRWTQTNRLCPLLSTKRWQDTLNDRTRTICLPSKRVCDASSSILEPLAKAPRWTSDVSPDSLMRLGHRGCDKNRRALRVRVKVLLEKPGEARLVAGRWTRVCLIAIHSSSSDAHTIGRTTLVSVAANEVVDKYPHRLFYFIRRS